MPTLRASYPLLLLAATAVLGAPRAADPVAEALARRAQGLSNRDVDALRRASTDTSEAGDIQAQSASLLLVEALLRRGDAKGALHEATRLESLWPGSPLVQRARLFAAWARIETGDWSRGLDRLVEILSGDADSGTVRLARQSLEGFAASGRLQPEDYFAVAARLPTSDPLFAALRSGYRSETDFVQAPVAIILPRTGPYGALGKRMTRGAMLAIEQARAAGARVRTVLLDEGGDAVGAVRTARALLALDPPAAVVGPMTSGSATAVLAALEGKNFPIILPAATSPGIAGLHSRGFQLNLTTEALGEASARHAWDCQGAREAAILDPQGEYGGAVAEGFRRVFEGRGGRIFWQQSYPAGRNDFRGQLLSLRKAWLQGLAARGDSTHGGPFVFAPVENASEAIAMGGQAAAIDFTPRWIGSSGWHDAQLLQGGASRLDGAAVATDFAPDESRPEWKAFAAAYLARWKEAPDRVAVLGYEAARLALHGASLARGTTYPGLQGPIRFDPAGGYNLEARLLRVSGTSFVQTPGSCVEAR